MRKSKFSLKEKKDWVQRVVKEMEDNNISPTLACERLKLKPYNFFNWSASFAKMRERNKGTAPRKTKGYILRKAIAQKAPDSPQREVADSATAARAMSTSGYKVAVILTDAPHLNDVLNELF